MFTFNNAEYKAIPFDSAEEAESFGINGGYIHYYSYC